jgi:hypothetical protein
MELPLSKKRVPGKLRCPDFKLNIARYINDLNNIEYKNAQILALSVLFFKGFFNKSPR